MLIVLSRNGQIRKKKRGGGKGREEKEDWKNTHRNRKKGYIYPGLDPCATCHNNPNASAGKGANP